MVIKMILQTILFSIISLIELFILTKLMGYRQITQLSMYDYVIGITIGSIASEMVVLSNYKDIIRPFVGMIIYTLFTVCLSLLSRSSLKLRHFIEGNPITLYQNDKIETKSLAKAKMDINELLMQLRIQGYFDLTQIERIILETKYRPTIVDDLSINPDQELPLISLIINGNLLENQLRYIHKDEEWLKSQLKVQGYKQYQDIALALCDQDNNITFYSK